MSIIVTALALAAGAQAPATPVAQPADHSRHQQHGQKDPSAKDCCCCGDQPEGKKMACCAKHEQARHGDHAGHSSH